MTLLQKRFYNRLLQTGWQSWSTKGKSLINYPVRNYLPLDKEFTPKIVKLEQLKKPVTGWCSWYAFGPNISEEKIIRQCEWFNANKHMSVDYILIDDGWTRPGDWNRFNQQRFSNGIKQLSETIKNLGFKPGIWIAPFLVDKKSNLFGKHKRLLAKKNSKYIDGEKLFEFKLPFTNKYILDIRKKEAIDFLHNIIDLLLGKYKFELIKIDFLYAIYFIPGITTHEAGIGLRNLLKYIRNKYPHVYTIACGAPLVPCLGLVDSMRVGPDSSFPLVDKIPVLNTAVNQTLCRLACTNTSNREWTKDCWNLDADAFSCRKSLGIGKKQLLNFQQIILDTKGNLFLGDDMPNLSQTRLKEFILPLFQNNN